MIDTTKKVYLELGEVASRLRKTVGTVRRWVKDPDHPLQGYKLGRRSMLIAAEDFDRFMAGKKIGGSN